MKAVSPDLRLRQRWLPYCRPDSARIKLRLFYFAHAGGSALVFRKWSDYLPWTVQICAVQLPWREGRLNEPFIMRMPRLIEELSQALLPLADRPVALLGLSLGAKIAFEFARHMNAQPGLPEIAHLFVSGRLAPHMPSHETPIYSLPDEEFIRRLHEFGGTPQEVFFNSRDFPDVRAASAVGSGTG